MNPAKDALGIMLSGHTLAQKKNYLKYLLCKKGEVLHYDPVTISIVATTRCTLSCDMCPTHSSIVPRDYPHIQKNVRDMDIKTFKEIVDRFSSATTVQIIGSGEPMLNKDFFSMVEYAAEKKMTVKTFSNGTTIEGNIKNILNSKLDGITISINGHDRKEFSRMTGMRGDIYPRIYDGVKKLIAGRNAGRSKIKIKLSFILDRYNYRSIPDMMALSLKLGVDHTFFCNFLSSPYEGLRASERALMAEAGVREEIRALFGSCPDPVRKTFTPPVLIDNERKGNGCNVHFSQIRCDGDGNVSSCSMMLLNMAGNGNYKEDDVWNNKFFRDMRRVFLSEGGGSVAKPCTVCPDNKGAKI